MTGVHARVSVEWQNARDEALSATRLVIFVSLGFRPTE